MSIEQYWIGKGLDLDDLWRDYDAGSSYIEKVSSRPLHLLRLSFGRHPLHLPLFDHEVLFKTVKGTFHDVKAECLTPKAYDESVPIFLYRVDRGSGVFEFLAQFDPLMTWIVALGAAAMWYRKAVAADQKFDDDRLAFLRKNFPNIDTSETRAYMKAWTTWGRRRVLERLIDQDLQRVEMSKSRYDPSVPPIMVDMSGIVELGRQE
jgi:hypothetical protein